jgi:hypothetical protein
MGEQLNPIGTLRPAATADAALLTEETTLAPH